jgi:1,4-dihydroxy-2-naphthoate octaprenyltransferase
MNNRLREYIDNLFATAPSNMKAVEVKEEILQNLTDKYNDLIAEGKSEDVAFNIAVASIGDVSDLIRELQGLPQQYNKISEENDKQRQRTALMTAIAIGLYIFSPVPVILIQNEIGLVFLFGFIAIATGILVFNGVTKSKNQQVPDTMVEEFKEWRERNSGKNQLQKSITSAIWAIGVVIYFLISFSTSAWYITWVIFLVIAAVEGVVKALFDMSK